MSLSQIVLSARKISIGICMAAVAIVLTACTSTSDVTSGLSQNQQSSQTKVLSPNPAGEVIGNGNVRVTLLVPTTIPGGAAVAAKDLRNGASMAMNDFGRGRIQLVVKDTKGQAAEAQAKAGEAVSEGSSLVLGPLFAANVSAASGVTLPGNVPILAFSTDTSVARRGVYLFSYTPQSDTQRIASYASSLGKRSLTAFIPNNAEGSLRERILRQTVGASGIAINVVRYDRTPESIETIVSSSTEVVQSSEMVYVPEGGPLPGLILGTLERKGVNFAGKQILGSGSWEGVKKSERILQGAIYPGRDTSRFAQFSARYKTQFGTEPSVQAGLAYDAVTLASELVRLHGPVRAFAPGNFESARGFVGVNGAFRMQSSGITQRGLAINQIQNGASRVIEPAVSNFSGRGS
ncbi:MAG: penicillin-binding protein activator [Pseudomonadota bacterium]